MRFKGTALMAAVFMSLVLYYFFVDVPAEQKEKKQQEQAEKLLPFQAEEVVEFSLTGKGEPISLRRKDLHKWELVLPLTATGDTTEADSFISEIENLKKTRVVEENPKDLSIYGLSSPLFKIHFKLRNKQEETLLIGDETPLGGSLYFMRKNHPEVMMAKSSQSRFEKTVYDFRDKTLLNFSTGSIRRIQIISENNPLELKRTDDTWEISGNIHARGDKDAIMNFLQSIQFSRVKHFVNENPESLEPYGLNSPTLKLVLGDDATHTLSLGTHKAGKGYYAKVNNSNNIVLVDTKLFETLSQKAVNFLDKTLLEFEEDDVLELTLKSEKEAIHVVRDKNNDWNIQTPIKCQADLSTINSLLFDLKEARINQFIKISMESPELFGLDSPRKSLTVKMKNSTAWTLQLGNHSADGEYVFSQRTGETTVFSLSKSVIEKLFRNLHDLRNKKLLKFESNDVNKIHIQTADEVFELEKSGPQWSLVKPKTRKVEHFGNDLVWTLKGLEFNSPVSPLLSPEVSGLNSPEFTITLFKNMQEVASLKIGKLFEQDQEYLVEANNLQYRVKEKYLDSIPSNLNKIRSK